MLIMMDQVLVLEEALLVEMLAEVPKAGMEEHNPQEELPLCIMIVLQDRRCMEEVVSLYIGTHILVWAAVAVAISVAVAEMSAVAVAVVAT
jgi:hypothetical protein